MASMQEEAAPPKRSIAAKKTLGANFMASMHEEEANASLTKSKTIAPPARKAAKTENNDFKANLEAMLARGPKNAILVKRSVAQ